MSKKADRFYFENLVKAAEWSCRAADYLEECISDYNPEKLGEMIQKMHEFEHSGDGEKHEMSAALARAFVTPVDREDLALISQCIDDVSDCIEEVMQSFYMYRIESVTSEAGEFSKIITMCCRHMRDMLAEFVNFKKPEKLHKMIIELNHIEEDCDKLYLKANRHLTEHAKDALEIMSWRDIYNKMENCTDACESVGNCVETVVMKNT